MWVFRDADLGGKMVGDVDFERIDEGFNRLTNLEEARRQCSNNVRSQEFAGLTFLSECLPPANSV